MTAGTRSRLAVPAPVRPQGGVRLRPAPAGPAARRHRTATWEPVRLVPARRASAVQVLRRAVALTPGWPLRYLLVGFPLWWVLGLSTFIFPILAVPMVVTLVRNRPVRLPPGFVLWALFLVWQVLSLAMFQMNPPNTHAGASGGRLVSIAFTAIMYAVVTVVLLYVGNLPTAQVSQAAIARWMGAFFFTVVAGGYLGLLLPHLTFRSPLELLLPHRLAAQTYVQTLVHPVTAQIQSVLGTDSGRPSAPFGYTNTWGNVVSILLVWFVAAWVAAAPRGRRLIYGLAAVAAFVPIVLSLNRGLWIGLVVTVVWLGLRQFAFGRVGVLLAGLAAVVVASAVLVATPLFSVIGARLQNGDSNSIRAYVAHQSIVAVQHSPIVGYGGTRHTDGSAASIAIGPTPGCGNCGNVATGSTGQLWSIMFNQGWGGVIWYFGFFAVSLWVYRRQRGRLAEAALVTVALVFVYMWFYTEVPVAPSLTMVAVALLWRGHDEAAPAGRRGRPLLRRAG